MEISRKEFLKTLLPKRTADANKYSVGSLLCVCGSRGFAGAAVLSLRAALRSGAGFVRCVLPESIYPIVSSAVPEAVFVPMPEGVEGALSGESTSEVLRLSHKADAVLFGCGMGLCEYTEKLTRELLLNCEKPLLVDADGLNLLSKHIDILEKREFPIVLTPHTGEMSRLCEYDSKYINANRELVCEEFVSKYPVTLVLKGKGSLIAEKGREIFKNPTGNSGMAVAGSGDVLAGMTASFMAQGASAFDSAVLGAYIHGLAGDIAKDELTEYSLLPSDIVDKIPLAIKAVLS